MRRFFKKNDDDNGPAEGGGKGNILIVDDSPTETYILKGILEKGGYSVVTATDGESGVAEAKRIMPDLVLNGCGHAWSQRISSNQAAE